MKLNTKFIVRAAVIGGIYAALTLALSPISYGSVQFRVAEALTVLAYFSPCAVVGLTVGCAIANLWSPYGIIDIVVGASATFLGAIIAYKLPKKGKWFWLVPVPNIIINALFVGGVITFSAGIGEASLKIFLANALSVALPQAVVCYLLGMPLMMWLKKDDLYKKLF